VDGAAPTLIGVDTEAPGRLTYLSPPLVTSMPVPPTAHAAPDRIAPPFLRRETAIGVPAALLCALAAILVASRAPPEERLARAVFELLVIGVPVLAGIFALRSPHNRRFGVVLIAAGYAWSLTALAEASASIPYSVGRVVAWTVPPMLIYLMLAFPDGRLETPIDRGLFGLCIGTVTLYVGSALFIDAYPTQTPWATCRENCPENAFQLFVPEPGAMDGIVQPVREGLTAVLLLGVIVRLIHITRTASPFRRHAMLPVVVLSVVCAGTLVAFQAARRFDTGGDLTDDLGVIWSLTVPGVAGAFLAGMIRQRVMLGETLSALSTDLNRRADPAHTRRMLARVLGDASVELFVPDATIRAWRDTRGAIASTEALESNGRRLSIVRDDDGAPVAALTHDPALHEDEELAESVRGVVRASMQHARLTRQLARSLVDLEESRARIARAADAERSRIERDLHDGAQQRLIALRLHLSMAAELGVEDPRQWAASLGKLGAEVDEVLEELRELAHGVYPSLLTDRGLAEALCSVAAEAPIPVAVTVEGSSELPIQIQTAVYFTCVEAIQNACKHAEGVRRLRLALRQDDGLTFEVDDDGAGFRPGASANGGLRNMRDRIEAVGGVLTINTAPGRGTRVCGFVPLAAGGSRH
jgi:signal transduction histidine kinase